MFHESRGKHYFDGGFSEGDVLGIMIDLPEKNPVSQFPPTYKDKVIQSLLLLPHTKGETRMRGLEHERNEYKDRNKLRSM